MSLQYGKSYRLERKVEEALAAGVPIMVKRGEAFYRISQRADGTREEVLLEKLAGWEILGEPVYDELRETSAPDGAVSNPNAPGRSV